VQVFTVKKHSRRALLYGPKNNVPKNNVPKNIYIGNRKKDKRLRVNKRASFLLPAALNAFPEKNMPIGGNIQVDIIPFP
jgi:hypothetical protein